MKNALLQIPFVFLILISSFLVLSNDIKAQEIHPHREGKAGWVINQDEHPNINPITPRGDTTLLLASRTRSHFYDEQASGWVNYDSTTYFYNEIDKLVELEVFDFLYSNNWFQNSRSTRQYNSDGSLASATSESLHSETGTWEIYFQRDYEYYVESGWLKSITSSMASPTDTFEKRYRIEYEYNTEGQLIRAMSYEFTDQSTWEIKVQKEFTRNEQGLLAKEYTEHFTADAWHPSHYRDYTYNEKQQLVFEHNFNWITSNSQWALDGRVGYSYNSRGLLSQYIEEKYSLLGDVLTGLYKLDYTYNEAGNLNNKYHSYWNDEIDDWWMNYHITYFYEEDIQHEENTPLDNGILIFPNPSPGVFQIDVQNIALAYASQLRMNCYNGQGQLVAKQLLRPGLGIQQVNLSKLPAGIYLLELLANKERIVRKVQIY